MTWFKVDDRLAFHPKVLEAGNTAMGLWVRAGAWSASQLTDGYVPAALLSSLGGTRRTAELLVKAGLWGAEPDGWRFHDWLDWQPAGDDVKLSQNAESRAGSFANHIRWHVKKSVSVPHKCTFCADAEAERDAES